MATRTKLVLIGVTVTGNLGHVSEPVVHAANINEWNEYHEQWHSDTSAYFKQYTVLQEPHLAEIEHYRGVQIDYGYEITL